MTAFEEIGRLGNIPISVDAELARRTMTVRDILALERGCIVRMLRSAGENIDVGGTMIGSGEIVIIEETVGVRITDFNEED
jgi:flagellar motor switch protein FliN/FliY